MNYRWVKVKIKNQIQSFFYHKQKNGFSLYNPFIDLYIDPKTKAVLSLLDSLILIIFYSSLTDFYYLGPYLLNLISSIKFVCNSKEITTKIINENFLDINTMICDLIGFFNGFTRALCQDYNCYLGCDAIYNERCFLHLRKNNNDSLLVMCRERSGSNDYFQLKSLGQIKSKQRDKMQKNFENEIEIKNSNILAFLKYKKSEKHREYLTFDYSNKIRKNIYNEDVKNNNDILNPKLENSMFTNYLDLPSESQILDDDENMEHISVMKNNNNGQILEVFDFINNVTNKNGEIIGNNNDKSNIADKKQLNNNISKSYNYKKENNFYEEDNYKIFNPKKSSELNNFDFNNKLQMKEIKHNYFKNNTTNFDKRLTMKNMDIIKNIDFDDLNSIDSDDNVDNKENQNFNYENIMKESLINNFKQINNNYIDKEISQVFDKNNNFNFSGNINSNNNFNYNYNLNNSIYYPTQDIREENNFNINNNQSIVPYIPPLNMNNINNFNFPTTNIPLNQFSQNDLSFLGGYSKFENLKEDYLKINHLNPEIISEFKEKMCFYHSLTQSNNKLLKISLKGYIGINIRPPNIINNKEFYINFLTEKWKISDYFLNKEFNKKIEQITENIYKISLLKQKNIVKLITYSINQNLIETINLIKTNINIYNNNLIYKFNCANAISESIKRIEIILEYKNNFQMFNNIKTDGNITHNNNIKTNIIYNNYIKEGQISFPINNIFFYIKKINIEIVLKNTIISNMNCKISFSNSINQSQESLPCKKTSLLSFQYE